MAKTGANSIERPLVVRFVGKDPFDDIDWPAMFPGRNLLHNGVQCVFGGHGDQDVLAVLDGIKYDQTTRVKKGGVWAWNTEMGIHRPYPKCFDLIFFHQESDERFVQSPPVLNWWVKKSFDELASMEPPTKTHAMSAIASTRSHVPGHIARSEFIELVEKEFPDVHIFGRGRARELSDKWDGLAPYRFTIAIENASLPHYWTEKITDAFMSYSVPLYYGAPNIGEYFPEDSYIWLPIDEPARALEVIRQAINDDSWERRLEAVADARRLILERWCLAEQVTRAVNERKALLRSAPTVTARVLGRRVWEDGWVRGVRIRKNLGIVWRFGLRLGSRVVKRIVSRGR